MPEIATGIIKNTTSLKPKFKLGHDLSKARKLRIRHHRMRMSKIHEPGLRPKGIHVWHLNQRTNNRVF